MAGRDVSVVVTTAARGPTLGYVRPARPREPKRASFVVGLLAACTIVSVVDLSLMLTGLL